MTDLDDTIVAVSSLLEPGGRAIVRLSGSNALNAAQGNFHGDTLRPYHRAMGALRLPSLPKEVKASIYYWACPNSYTGQDVIEIHSISSPSLVELLIAELLHQGMRVARPGEFTLRGFLAGKLDLTRAEAVLGVIEAGNRGELKQALAQLAGNVARPLRELREDLLNLLADVEAGLDFSDEDLQFVGQEDLLKRLGKGMALITLVGKQVEARSLTERPVRVVLIGQPNAGKSSLFNALGRSRALVSSEAGTTRDYLIQPLDLDGIRIELVDTAGWNSAPEGIEQRAQSLAREQTETADLLLLCVPVGQSLSSTECALISSNPRVSLVRTKADLCASQTDPLATSVQTGEGLNALRAFIKQRVQSQRRPALAPSLSRCRQHVDACLEHLRQAHHVALFSEPAEILALELRSALQQLGEMVGEIYTDDLLDRIFSRFCVGK